MGGKIGKIHIQQLLEISRQFKFQSRWPKTGAFR